tara:strand:- start:434 stop:2425 length:1992 start_codon:yes stop_codon:yes gene_type:complete
MNTFMDRVNAIVQKNQMPQVALEPVYPDAGIGALENVVSGAPRQTEIMGQPHMLAYINPQEERMLRDAGGAGLPGPDGVPAYWFHSDDGPSFSESVSKASDSVSNFFSGSTTTNDNSSNNDGPAPTVFYNDYSDPSNPVLDTSSAVAARRVGDSTGSSDYALANDTNFNTNFNNFGSNSANAAAVNAAVAEAVEYGNNNTSSVTTPATVAPTTVVGSNVSSGSSQGVTPSYITGALPPPSTARTADTVLAEVQTQLNAAISKAQGNNSSSNPDVYWNDEISDLAAARDRIRDTGEFTISDGLAETKSDLTLDESKGSLNFSPEVENTARENLANLLTPGDNAEYVNGQLVVASGPDKGKSLEGGGYVTNKAGVKDYIYGVSDDFSNNIPVDTTGMSEADAIAARANQQMLQDIPPSDLAYFGSFLPGQVIPVIGSYLGSKMLQSGIEGRRAIVEAETAALAAGAEPRYNDDGEYIGHMTYDDEMANTFGSGNIYTEDYDGASTVNFGNDQSNRFIAGDGASVEGEGSYVTALSDLETGVDNTTTTTDGDGGDGGDDDVVDTPKVERPIIAEEIWKRYYKGSGSQFMPPWLRKWMSGESIDLILTKVTVDGKEYYKTKDGRYIEPSELVGTAVSDVGGGSASPFEAETETETETEETIDIGTGG